MKTLAVVASVGARTPVGLTAQQTGFVYRTAAVVLHEAPLLDQDEKPITMAFLQTLDPLLVGPDRLYKLAVPALQEALSGLGPLAPRELRSAKLILCLDEYLTQKQNGSEAPAPRLASQIHRVAQDTLGSSVSLELCCRGPAGPGYVLPDALQALELGTLDAVILGGVHSDYDPVRIAYLGLSKRLFTMDNLDALIPGESASFVVLLRPERARRLRLRPHAQLHSIGTGWEKARPDNDESAFEAVGLTIAVRKALSPLVESKLQAGWQLSDMCFEMMRVHEWQSMSVRTQAHWCDPQYADAPAQRLGYMGSAAVPLCMTLATQAWRHKYAPHSIALLYAGSDAGERTAMVLSETGE